MVAKRSSFGQSLAVGILGFAFSAGCLAPAAFGQQPPPLRLESPSASGNPAAPPKATAADTAPLAVTEAESKIAAALNKPTRLDFVDTPLKDVITFLSEAHSIPISINRKALEEAGVDVEMPVSHQIRDLRLATALQLLLRPLGLTYDTTDELMEITTPEDLLARPHIRLYDCRDLLALGPDGKLAGPNGAAGVGLPVVPADYSRAPVGESAIDGLAETITRAVDPQSWRDAGGEGTGTIDNFKGMLIISQTSRAHRQIENLLNTIRETAGLPRRSSKGVE